MSPTSRSSRIPLGGGLRLALLPAAPGALRAEMSTDRCGSAPRETTEAFPRRIEALGIVPQLDEDLLHDLFGHTGVPQQPPGQGKRRSGVASVHLGERVVAPAGDGKHEAVVARILQVGSHVTLNPSPNRLRMTISAVFRSSRRGAPGSAARILGHG